MSILLTRTNEAYGTYKILILYEDKLINYDAVKNDIKFWEKWTDNLKKELNNRYYIILNILESLKRYKGQGKKLKDPIKIGLRTIDLYLYEVNMIMIIFSIFYITNTIVVWGIGSQNKDYNKIKKYAEKFMDKNNNNKKLMTELLGNYRILILFGNNLVDYETVKNDIKFLNYLKENFNNQDKTILNRLESLKELEGKKEKLKDQEIDLFSDRVNKSIRIIFSIVNNTNIIIVWGIGYHEEAYRDILRRAKSFIKNHQESILDLLGIKTIYR
jgi:mRNA-degrading endonuclease RelE of RelBE toxin-antitoxin system